MEQKPFLHLLQDGLKHPDSCKEEFIMIATPKYCQACIDKLFPATAKTEKEKQFLAAHTFAPRPATNYGPTTEDGTCEKCGQRSIVTYYRLPA